MKILLFFIILCLTQALYGIESYSDRIKTTKIYSHKALSKLADYLLHSSKGNSIYKRMQKKSEWFLSTGEFRNPPTKSELINVDPEYCAYYYLLAGNSELKEKMRVRFLEYAKKPLSFYLNAKNTPWMYRRKMASVTTGQMLQKLAVSYDLCRSMFSNQEQAFIEKNLKEKGIIPSLNYLKNAKSLYNWHAVVACGLYFTAKAVGDKQSEQYAANFIKRYLERVIEKDGSYGEGAHYLLYPVCVILKTVVAMPEETRNSIFSSCALRLSPEYLMYCKLFFKWEKCWVRIQFRDGPQFSRGLESFVLYSLQQIYPSNIVAEYLKRTQMPEPTNVNYLLLKFVSETKGKDSKKLDKLAHIKIFDNGECFIRSGWDANAFVFAMLSGGACRTGYSHDRPARNGIALAFYGEYFLVNPGLSRYSTQQRWDWEINTRAHNVITIDRVNQKSKDFMDGLNPRNPLYQPGTPDAKVVFSASGKVADVLCSDAANSYAPVVNLARRTVLFIRDPGYYIIYDHIQTPQDHSFQSYFHFNNLDGNLKMTRISPLYWKLQRPHAGMWLYATSPQQLTVTSTPTKFHHNFQPGFSMNTKVGTSMELEFATTSPTKGFTQLTVIYPYSGNTPPSVQFSKIDNGLKIKTENGADCLYYCPNTIRVCTKNGEDFFRLE